MGDDFSNRQCYVGNEGRDELRLRVRCRLIEVLTSTGYVEVPSETEATRSLVIGPPGRWIFIGDTAGSTEGGDPIAFASLSAALSTLVPVVDVQMSDSAAVHIYLYKNGSLVDKYGNAAFPFFEFKNEEEAAGLKGHPDLWKDYVIPPYTIEDLRAAWVQDWGADSILGNTAKLLGWDQRLSCVGYTLDDEGLGIKYDEYLQLEDSDQFRSYISTMAPPDHGRPGQVLADSQSLWAPEG